MNENKIELQRALHALLDYFFEKLDKIIIQQTDHFKKCQKCRDKLLKLIQVANDHENDKK